MDVYTNHFYLFSLYYVLLMLISSHKKIVLCGADKEPIEGSGQSAAADNVAPETLDGRTDGADVYVIETSFSVGKSPVQNGIQASKRTSGTAGLGEGSPKVCPFVPYCHMFLLG